MPRGEPESSTHEPAAEGTTAPIPIAAAPPDSNRVFSSLLHRTVLYPDRYVWYVFASTLDIIVTVTVLKHLGFREANSFAQKSIEYFGTWGLIGLKFLSVIIVVLICEFVGRRRERLGRAITVLAIALSLFPVAFAGVQVLYGLSRGEIVHTDWPRADPDDQRAPIRPPRPAPRPDMPTGASYFHPPLGETTLGALSSCTSSPHS